MTTLLVLALALTVQTNPLPAGSWVYTEKKDPMTDEQTSVASFRYHDGFFAVLCPTTRSVDVRFGTTDFFGNGVRAIALRFDDDPPTEEYWRYQDQIAYPVKKQRAAILVDTILHSKRLRVRGVTYRGQIVDADVDLEAGRNGISKVAAMCGMQWQRE